MDILKDFEEFTSVNMQLRPETVKHTTQDIRRFLKKSDGIISYKAISECLKSYVGKAPKTYNQQLTSLRRFVRDFLGYDELISSFKLAPVDESKGTDVTNEQVRAGFYAQKDVRAKAIYLFIATTGLRKCEVLSLRKENIDFKLRAVKPDHFTGKKRGEVPFYNEEAEE